MAKIYRDIQIKLNQLVSENVRMIRPILTYQQSVFERYHYMPDIYQSFYLQDGGKN